MVTKEQVIKVEQQIYQLRKSVRYDIRELTIEIMVNKYEKGLDYQEEDEFQDKSNFYNVLFIPEYQRDFTWDKPRQAKFIESILLGLPIPLVFVAQNKDSAWEIVDGSQRIRTLHAFVNDDLRLERLERISTLNGFSFKDLDISRQGKFVDTALRMIALSEDADDEVKRDMFERINRGSDLLKPMEKRKGDKTGVFTDFLYDLCAKSSINALLRELAPLDKWLEHRQERQELVLRYFALTDNNGYARFPKETGIAKFLDDYLEGKNKGIDKLSGTERQKYLETISSNFRRVLEFVQKSSEYGFRRTHHPQTKRVIFEAISVGVYVALNQNPKLTCNQQKMASILNSGEFEPFWRGNTKTHDPVKVKARVEFIANKLLEK